MKSFNIIRCLSICLILPLQMVNAVKTNSSYLNFEKKVQETLKKCDITVDQKNLQHIIERVISTRKKNADIILHKKRNLVASTTQNEAFYLDNNIMYITIEQFIESKKPLDTIYHVVAWSYNKLIHKLYFDFCLNQKRLLQNQEEPFYQAMHKHLEHIRSQEKEPTSNIFIFQEIITISEKLSSELLASLVSNKK